MPSQMTQEEAAEVKGQEAQLDDRQMTVQSLI
jgi:hypothetical protein